MMADLLDYLRWRGDLPFSSVPVCDLDFLVLCRLSYVPFDGMIPDSPDAVPPPLGEVATQVLTLISGVDDPRSARLKEDETLLALLPDCARFASLGVADYVDVFDAERQEQFSAVTFVMPSGGLFVIFRGTDYTLVGWKEDFNMVFADAVPAQRDAVAYLERMAARFPNALLRIGGHSKGGNLAVYAAAFCSEETQRRILSVRSLDGPGFNEKAIAAPGFQRITPRTRTFVPQSSIIGMLLEHEEDFSIIHSRNTGGLKQHDLYSWDVQRGDLVSADERTNSSQFVDKALKNWVAAVPPDQREKLIDGVYSLLTTADATTLRDLRRGRSTLAIIRAAAGMDDETKAMLLEAFRVLRASIKGHPDPDAPTAPTGARGFHFFSRNPS